MTDIDLTMLPDYLAEAAEHLEDIESLLLRLAEEPDNTELMNEIFRPIHSIKGAAQFIGLQRSSCVAHRLEDLLDLLRKGEHTCTTEVVELLISARDLIVKLAEELETTQTEISSVENMVEKITAEISGVAIDGAVAEAAGMEEETEVGGTEEEATAVAGENIVADEEPQQVEGLALADAENTTYKDENDQELFGIFLGNLREKIDLLHTRAAELENSADKVALLDSCAESLQALLSAANYMGYEELASIYSNWLEDIEAVQDALGNNEEVPYDFMEGYLLEINSLFPQLAQNTTADNTTSEFVDVGNDEQQQKVQQQTITNDGGEQNSENNVEKNSVEENSNIDLSLLPDYLLEAAEHLEEMESLLLSLVEQPDSTELMNEIFRPIHSIKGAAQFIGLERSSHLAHRLEDLLDLLRKGERPSTPEVVELLISARDLIVKLADELEVTQTETLSVENMVEQITAAIDGSEMSASSSVSESEPVLTEPSANPAVEEENDQELFAIFLENLREKIDLIHTRAGEFESSADKIALLERCTESLQGLHAAANYMSYEELTSIYSNWLEDIVEVQEALGNNEEVPYDFMDGYLAEIYSLFPQLVQQQTTLVSSSSETTLEELETTPSESGQVASKAAEEENLFEKLSKSLDVASSKTEDAEYELLHGVFEEMISEQENVSASTQQDATQTKIALDVTSAVDEKPSNRDTSKQVNPKENKAAIDRKSDKSVVRKSLRVDSEKIDSLINQVGELVVDRAYFFQLFDDMRGLQQHLKDDIGLDQKEMKSIRAFTYRMSEAISSLSRTSNDLQEGVMKVRMLPISQLFNRYPRLVHDLTRNNDKKVNLKFEGEDTELDKMVVEKLSDPLIHIIRNAIDHGLEETSQRVNAGKSETGTLFLKSYHESNQVVIEVFDDGRGINPDLVKAKAVEKGIVSKNEVDRMTSQEVIRLITTAGFSTAKEITDTSGRGVGMDVVRKNIEKLNGTLEIDSRPGKGTSIKLKIPLTLAIIPAHLVRVGGNMYTIPLANIEETLRIKRDETTIIEGTEVVYLRGKTLPVIHLSNLFSVDSQTKNSATFFVVVVNTGTQKLGLVVDELLGQEEVVIKPLVEYLRDESGFSGATIIGDGSISLILDIYEIANMTANQQIRRQNELLIARQLDKSGGHLDRVAG